MSAVDPFTRTEHSGCAARGRARPRRRRPAILIGYDGYDFPQFMRAVRVRAGRLHGRTGVHARLGRALSGAACSYVTTLFHPRVPGWLELLAEELDRRRARCQDLPRVPPPRLPTRQRSGPPSTCSANGSRAAMFGFEDTAPPETPTLSEYYEAIGRLAADYPDVPIQLNHGANARPDGIEFPVLRQMVAACPNVLVSTSVLGGPLMDWEDEWRYPFPRLPGDARALRGGRCRPRSSPGPPTGPGSRAGSSTRSSSRRSSITRRSRRRRPSASTSARTRSGTGGLP